MADFSNIVGSTKFKEACCIDAQRVYDSCCDRDCLEDLQCYFTPDDQAIINNAESVRARSAKIIDVAIDVEPVSFNKGYYACTMTFFFVIDLDVLDLQSFHTGCVKGVAFFTKKLIMFGSEGNIKSFSNKSRMQSENRARFSDNAPKCTVQCVEPIALSARIGDVSSAYECCPCLCPAINEYCGGPVNTRAQVGTPTVFVTLGIFSIVQLTRQVQM
ncbi:MAG: hypothetical protein KBS41_05450, partial [Oscillospiraceae bacterium]|nr:hypothetical protein [Candidatus Equicaccousia limihippi]